MAVKRTPLKAPVSLGKIFDSGFLGKRGGEFLALYKIQEAWLEIAGVELSKRAYPKEVKGKKLMVAVESPVWAHQLSTMKGALLTSIREKRGIELQDIKFLSQPLPPTKTV